MKILFYLLISIALSTSAFSATYYVSVTGNNSNPGSNAKPWKSIAYAVSNMNPGDTTYVSGGVYKEAVVQFKKSGTSSAPIKLLSVVGQKPVIDCIDKTKYHRVLIENGDGYSRAMGYITIEGFEIRNCYNAVKFSNANNLTLRRNWFHDNITGPVLGNGTRILIDRNRINRNGSPQYGGHGIYVAGTAVTITNNLIYDNRNYGIQLNGSPSSIYDPKKHAGPEYALSANWVIANNTIAYNRNRAGLVIWGSTCNNAQVTNNIFYENGVTLTASAPQGIDFVSTTCKGIVIKNNISYASGSGATVFLSSAAKEGVNYTRSGNIEKVNPLFVGAPAMLPSAPNFALTSLSPAINRGLTISFTKSDFIGISRPQAGTFDIGAYEFTGKSL